MNNDDFISLIIFSIILIIARYFILKAFPKFVFNAYIWMFLIPFFTIYYHTKNFDFSLASGLLIVILRTIYRYVTTRGSLMKKNYNSFKNNFLFCLSLILIILGICYENECNKIPLKLINFIFLAYIFSSIYEYIVHKYVMHCDNKSIFTNAEKIPIISKYYKDSCSKHKKHHLDVKPDMKVLNNSIKESMYMGWDVFIIFCIFLFDNILVAKLISGYNIEYKYILLITIISSFLWCYLWNKTHSEMHSYDSSNYSLKDGPHDNNMFNMSWISYLLYNNHKMHHIQKGKKKGNFNIIILGADEWFNDNRKSANNKSYCKIHSEEEICKKKLT